MRDERLAAQPASLEIHDDRFRPLVQANALLETLGEGYDWLEGPVWFADHDRLYVSDLPADRILAWSPHGGVSTFRTGAGFPNGKARDREGRLLVCSHRDRCVYRIELDGTTTVADRYAGKRLNAPNDIVCAADGAVWFTDPIYGLQNVYEGGVAEPELAPAVYRLDLATGALNVAADDFVGPNGLAFSPDGQVLYVAETGDQYAADPHRCIRRFAVDNAGALSGGDAFAAVHPGYADGFRVDEGGRLWVGAGDGVHCLDANGALLGKIVTPHPVQNLCFGGRGGAQLFLCAAHTLMSVFTNTRSCLPC